MSRDTSQVYDILNLYPFIHKPILVIFTGGSLGVKIESMSDAETISSVTAFLRQIYGERRVPNPSSYIITRWQKDPYSFGSYSYLKKNGSYLAYGLLAKPIMNRVFFAGEATSTTDPATVHGAYMTGIRAAQELLHSAKDR